MAVKIRVRDFQSLGDVGLVIDGLTVVTGANNTGKSALMRALRAAFQNAKGTSFIRHGATKASVEVDFGDGHTLLWEKGKGKADKPTYVIDGGKPIYPGQGVPDEVRALGVRPITAGGREIWPQIAPQFQQVFLLDQPGSVMAEAVADVERVSKLNDALRLAASDQRAASGELTTRRSDLTNLEIELKRFDGLDLLSDEIKEIETKAALTQRVEVALQGLVVLRDRRDAAASSVAFLAPIASFDIPSATDGESIRELAVECASLAGLQTRLSKAASRVKSLSGVESLDIPDGVSAIQADQQALAELQALSKRHAKAKRQVEKLEAVDLSDSLDTGATDKLLSALVVVQGLATQLAGVIRRVVLAEADTVKVDAEWEQVNHELSEALGGLSQCPVCESPLQPKEAP